MILSYNDHKLVKKLNKLVDEHTNERQILSTLKDLRYKEIDKSVLSNLSKYFIHKDENDSPGNEEHEYHTDWYKNSPYKTFMEFFSRKLSDKKEAEILKSVKDCQMIIPNECYVEAVGSIKDTKKILRLKKKYDDVVKDLGHVGLDIKHYDYIDMKLLVSYYHRIHAPVTGKITQMIPIEGTDDLFGPNSLWVLEFETVKSPVYLLLVGESTIQDFDFLVEKGDEVDIFTCLGYFNWGSQTVILYNPKDYDGKIMVEEQHKYFVGDCIIKK